MARDLQYSGRVFICYRRTETAPSAGRLYDYLAEKFGEDQILMDVDSAGQALTGLRLSSKLLIHVKSCSR
jgi:hypothetical protein